MKLSPLAQAIQPTLIRALRDRARPESLDLGLGQLDLPVARPIWDTLRDEANRRAPYTPNLGSPELRAAIADHHGIDAPEVMVTCGVQEALAVAILGTITAGDDVLVPEPGFPAYANLVRAAGARPIPYFLDAERGFALDPERVASAWTQHTRAIVLNSPSNPTGALHTRESLAAVVDHAVTRGAHWISDEIYADFVWDGAFVSAADAAANRDSGIRLAGVSKSHAMMGWRIGWLTAAPDVIDGLKPLHQHLVTCAPTIAQAAATAALAEHDRLAAAVRDELAPRRTLALSHLRAMPGLRVSEAAGAFYLFCDVRAALRPGESTLQLAQDILDACDVIVIPGEGFGAAGAGFIRVAYSPDIAILESALERLRRFFNERMGG